MAVWSVVLWYDVCVVDYVIIIIYMCVFIIRRWASRNTEEGETVVEKVRIGILTKTLWF